MSDTHVWQSPEVVDDALRELAGYRLKLRYMVHDYDRDDPRRDLVVAIWGSLEEVEQRMRAVLTAPAPAVGEPRRVPGEGNTDAWVAGRVPFMRRNGGPQ